MTPSPLNKEIPACAEESLILDEMDTADGDMDTDDKDGSSQGDRQDGHVLERLG